MTNLTLVKSENFGEITCDIWRNDLEEMFMTSNQLGLALEYVDPRRAINKIVRRNEYLESAEFSVVTTAVPTSENIETRIFTEDGIYEVAMLSESKKAREFRAWIRNVLKGLRTGSLTIQQRLNLPTNYKEALQHLLLSEESREKLQQENEVLKPKAEKHDTFLSATNVQTMLEVAKSLDIGRNKLFRLLRYKRVLMINNMPFARFCNSGYFKIREFSIRKKNGMVLNCVQTLVTAKGLDYICDLLTNENKGELAV